ncbi:hypothetical protein M422DRAFT_240349 [Sphaerobolus stellatus SS14]|nr:hypothetical protein M422DRAFT_240349 [Sphaerobolus stellatus SS14]
MPSIQQALSLPLLGIDGGANATQTETITSLIKQFLADMNYVPLDINPLNEELENFMIDFMTARGLECQQLRRTLNLAASFIEVRQLVNDIFKRKAF